MDRYKLTQWQKTYLDRAKALIPSKSPEPWINTKTVSAGGIFAGGWTENENFIMLSPDGYSEHNPISGELVVFDRDTDKMYNNLDKYNRYLLIPSKQETIPLFGLLSGDGIYVSGDWSLSRIYPWWPNTTVILEKRLSRAWDSVFPLDTGVCDPGNWIKCGFSPSGKVFVILGDGGAEFFTNMSI